MSAFAVVYECSNAPVEPGALELIMRRLEHRGPDGSDIHLSGLAELGHWHFWTTPEEVGERQPLKLAEMPYTIVLDGRLDNRPDLVLELSIDPMAARRLSDAALILRAYDRWGEHCFEHFIGEFALVLVDEQNGELLCARDALGDRTLFYTFRGTRLMIASEPWALAGVADSGIEIDENAAAHYFALEAEENGQTLFKNIHELLPGQVILVSASGQRQWRYWQPDSCFKVRRKTDEEYAEEFRFLLEESIRCRLRSSTPTGILMSGGLDSTSVACIAARMLTPEPLTTLSYVFDELTECDERKYIEAVKEQWGIRSIQIQCDDAWPFKNWREWPRNPNQPEGNPYRLLKERAYQRAQTEGLRVLLTGGFGDHLYSAGKDWLTDLVTDGKILQATRELNLIVKKAGLRRTLQAGFIQRSARHLLNALPGGWHLRRKPGAPGWLTDLSAGYLIRQRSKPDSFIERNGNLVGTIAANSCSGEIFYASHHTLELRHPYRDRRLVEFVLALPAYQLYSFGQYKHILRIAMKGILPESIRTRIHPTSLEPLFLRGVEREKTVLRSFLHDPDSAWRKFVHLDWLLDHCKLFETPDMEGPGAVVSWFCFSFGTWYKWHIID